MKMKYRFTSVLALGFTIAASGQQSAPPTTQPADNGPTLAATLQFLQEKLSEKGRIGWAEAWSNQSGITRRKFVQLTDVMADPAACTLFTTETMGTTVDAQKGKTLTSGGKPINPDDLHTQVVETDTIALKDVEKITIEKMQDVENQSLAEAAHPDITVTVTPPVFFLKLSASKPVFSIHTSSTKGGNPPVEKDTMSKMDGFTFADEDIATRVAKAMTHAMELCGGGVTKKELF